MYILNHGKDGMIFYALSFWQKEYCKKHKRILLVNGIKSLYKVNFFEYFNMPEDPTIIFNTEQITMICTNPVYTIFPHELQNKMLDVLEERIVFTHLAENIFCYNGIPLGLPNDPMSETILVHSRSGGGNGYPLFKQLVFHQSILDICKERWSRLQIPYLCIHIRNTDYTCKYVRYFYKNEAIHSVLERNIYRYG